MKAETKAMVVSVRSIAPALPLNVRPRDAFIIVTSLAAGFSVWTMPPPVPLGTNGMHFLATMIVAVAFWVLDVFDEYIVGLMLLLSWVVFNVVPPKVALAGFAENSWFFTIGALGIAAAIGKTSLLQRLSLKLLRWIPIRCQKTYALLLLSAGVLSGPLLPTGKARAAVAVPVSQAVINAAGFCPRSHGSAAISLAAFIGFSQMSFMFLTAGEHCLIAWNFLPPPLKVQFGWLAWFLAALPAALTITVTMFLSLRLLLPLSMDEHANLARNALQTSLKESIPISRKERMSLLTLTMTVAGWLTTSLHGVNEAWVALAALLVFLISGVLAKDSFRNDVDWGLILFFGVLNSLAVVAEKLKVDVFFMTLSNNLLGGFSGQPFSFLLVVFILISAVRFFLRKTATAALFTVTLLPLSESVGIHPGALIVASVMIGECFLLGYQDGPYQIAYGGGNGSAFSHGQARKVLAAKYLATLLALAVSVLYWKFLGFIR